MKFILSQVNKSKGVSDLLAVPAFKDEITTNTKTKAKKVIAKSEVIDALDKKLGGYLLGEAIKEEFVADMGQIFCIHTQGKMKERTVVLMGLSNLSALKLDDVRKSAAEIYKQAMSKKAKSFSYVVPEEIRLPLFDVIQAVVEGILLAGYKFDHYFSHKKTGLEIEEVEIIIPKAVSNDLKLALDRGVIISDAVNLARDLINEGPNVATPVYLAKKAQEIGKKDGLKVEVFDEEKLKKEKMNLMLAVGNASSSSIPPRLIKLSYKPAGKSLKTLAILGKGVCFDSGGLDIKHADGMLDMKVDMSGAAAVLAIMKIIAHLKPKVSVVGYMAAVENGVGPDAYHPGDIIVSRKGISVEINNTDAEGRLILADTITYTTDNDKPDTIIDIATLTGACMVALGRTTAGLFSNDEKLSEAIISCGKSAGESFWPLPLSPDLREGLKTPVADIKNCGERYGGAITAALFLKEFVDEKTLWAHLDIAGPATNMKSQNYKTVGAQGFAIRTIVNYIMEQ